MILACARHLVPAAALLREGGWNQRDRGSVYRRFEGRDLDDSTVGLVGFGAVARALARRLSGFGTRILAHDPYVEPGVLTEHGVEASDLRTVMAEADFVSIHVPVTDETRRMLGPGQLALLKPTAYLINTGRSGAVDQEAMYDALKGGRIAGAALDVYDEEPLPEDSPLRSLENVILTPHIAGSTPGQIKVQSRMVAEQIQAIVEGREPAHILNVEAAKGALRGFDG